MNRNDLPAPNATCEICGRQYRRCKKCIELRSRGIEAWREHCDSIECYQTLVFVQTEDKSAITKEEYERVIAFELPEGRKPVKSVQDKLDQIKVALYGEEKKVEKVEEKENKDSRDNKDNKDSKWKSTKYRNDFSGKNVK